MLNQIIIRGFNFYVYKFNSRLSYRIYNFCNEKTKFLPNSHISTNLKTYFIINFCLYGFQLYKSFSKNQNRILPQLNACRELYFKNIISKNLIFSNKSKKIICFNCHYFWPQFHVNLFNLIHLWSQYDRICLTFIDNKKTGI